MTMKMKKKNIATSMLLTRTGGVHSNMFGREAKQEDILNGLHLGKEEEKLEKMCTFWKGWGKRRWEKENGQPLCHGPVTHKMQLLITKRDQIPMWWQTQKKE